jgi:hypothetical protein
MRPFNAIFHDPCAMVLTVDVTRQVGATTTAVPESSVVKLARTIAQEVQMALTRMRDGVATLGGGWTNGSAASKPGATMGASVQHARGGDIGSSAGHPPIPSAIKIVTVASNGVPTFGRRFLETEADTLATVGGYRIVGNKRSGVEPGFIGKKSWTSEDAKKTVTPGTTAHANASNLVDRWLDNVANGAAQDPVSGAPSRAALEAGLQNVLHDVAAGGGTLAEDAKAFLAQSDNASGPDVIALFRDETARGPLAVALKSGLLDGTARGSMATDGTDTFAPLGRFLKQDQLASRAKFTTAHYVKLDYYEADKFRGHYQIPLERAKGNAVAKLIHRWSTGGTPRERNEGAVRESLANTLMQSLGIESQKLKIVETEYADGTTKLLLDGTHVNGFKDFAGTPTKGDIYIKDGVLVQNTKRQTDTDGRFTGDPVLHTGMVDLGRNKILLLLMGDRDAIGSAGGNKGYVGNRFIGIDPGHALEANLLDKRGDVRTDFSFKQPSVFQGLQYKNFSMLDQSSLADKMEGVRQIKALKDSGGDTALFTDYATQFGKNRSQDANFSADIDRMRTGYEGRRDDILSTFAERLAVDDFHFEKVVDANGLAVPPTQARDDTLNVLDVLEKLTSKTTDKTESGIALDFLQVRSPADRKEWHVRQDPVSNNITFSFKGTKREAAVMTDQVEAFVERLGGGFRVSRSGGTLSVEIRPDKLSALTSLMNYATVKQAKSSAT